MTQASRLANKRLANRGPTTTFVTVECLLRPLIDVISVCWATGKQPRRRCVTGVAGAGNFAGVAYFRSLDDRKKWKGPKDLVLFVAYGSFDSSALLRAG